MQSRADLSYFDDPVTLMFKLSNAKTSTVIVRVILFKVGTVQSLKYTNLSFLLYCTDKKWAACPVIMVCSHQTP